MEYEKELQKKYRALECSNYEEIYDPCLMKLKADLESEGYTLDEAMKRSFTNAIIIKRTTHVYNRMASYGEV